MAPKIQADLVRWSWGARGRVPRLTGGNVVDFTAADALLERMPATSILHGDKGNDSYAVRRKIEDRSVAPNILPTPTAAGWTASLPSLYGNPYAIESMFGRIKYFRRIATRYDKLARNLVAAVYLVATICYWF